MDTIMIVLLVLGAAALLIILWVIGVYNNLARLNTLIEEAWSGIDIQLKRRYDLIPNLVAVVKQYSIHEKTVLEEITKFRSESIKATHIPSISAAEGGLTKALHNLFAVVENYPQLKANENFLSLQKELTGIEDEIQLSRRYYNGTVRNYNGVIVTFPASIVASTCSMHKKPYFELNNNNERENVNIQF